MVFKNFLSKAKDIDILSSIPDGVVLIGSDGKIEWVNELVPVLFALSKNDVLKKNINEIIESGLSLIQQAAESFKPAVGRIRPENAKEIYVEITAKPVEDYYVVSLRDVTQSYKTVTNIMVEHESSKKVNKDKNAFLVKLSNELKSPIHSISGFSQAMIDGLGGEMSEKQEKYIKIINKNSNDVLYLMNKIVELSKIESNMLDYDFQIFDFTNAIQSVIRTFDVQIRAKKLTLLCDFDEVVKKTIFSDENSLKLILQNILETSVNSTDIGSITVKACHPELEFVAEHGLAVTPNSTDKSFIMISVSDTGAGLYESDLSVLFDPYAQLDKANKKNIVRSIALASAKNLVKYLKGSIWAESESMSGTAYSLILPIEKPLD